MVDITEISPIIQLALEVALEDNPRATPEALTAEIVKSVRIAERLSGRMASPKAVELKAVELKPPSRGILRAGTDPYLPAVELHKATLLPAYGGEAPPVLNSPGRSPEEPEEEVVYWPGTTLADELAKLLPGQIEVSLLEGGAPGAPVTLIRKIRRAPMDEMKFVDIFYTLPGQETGPHVKLMMTSPTIEPEAIMEEIYQGAQMLLSRKMRKLSDPVIAPNHPPTQQDFDVAMNRARGSGNSERIEDPVQAEKDRASLHQAIIQDGGGRKWGID